MSHKPNRYPTKGCDSSRFIRFSGHLTILLARPNHFASTSQSIPLMLCAEKRQSTPRHAGTGLNVLSEFGGASRIIESSSKMSPTTINSNSKCATVSFKNSL
jgi:hypothetical protein